MATRSSSTLRSKETQVLLGTFNVHQHMTAITQTTDTSPADVTTIDKEEKVIDRELVDRTFEMTVLPDADVKSNIQSLIDDGDIQAVVVAKTGAKVGENAVAYFVDGVSVTETAATGQPQELTLSGMQHCASVYDEIESPVLGSGDSVFETARTQNASVRITASAHTIINVPNDRKNRPFIFWVNIVNPGVPNNYALNVRKVTGSTQRNLTSVNPSGAVQTAQTLIFTDFSGGADSYIFRLVADPGASEWTGLLQQNTQMQYNVSYL